MRNPEIIRVGSRASPLALRQTEIFLSAFKKKFPETQFEIIKIKTSGDKILDRFLSEAGGKGLFVKEIEEALLAEKIHFAVHSLKDLPATLPPGLELACFPKRESPWDLLISRAGDSLEQIKRGAVIGTSSLRRRSQIKKIRPELRFALLRGNIQTRLKRLAEGGFDAIVLAEAGVRRMGLKPDKATRLPILPAVGQGTLAIEIRTGSVALRDQLHHLNDPVTEQQARVERRVLESLGGDCNLPLGVFAQNDKGVMKLQAYLGTEDASSFIEVQKSGPLDQGLSLAEKLLENLWAEGAREIIQTCQANPPHSAPSGEQNS